MGTGTGHRQFLCPGQENKKGGGGGSKVFRGIMEFGMSRRINPKEKYVHISMKEIWRNLDDMSKKLMVGPSHLKTFFQCACHPLSVIVISAMHLFRPQSKITSHAIVLNYQGNQVHPCLELIIHQE